MSEHNKQDSVLDPVEEAIYDLMRGKVIIVVDDEDRENEGTSLPWPNGLRLKLLIS